MTFGISFKARVKDKEIIISMIDSKATTTNNLSNLINPISEYSKKLHFNENSIFSYISGGTNSNIKTIFNINENKNDFELFKKKYKELEEKSISEAYSLYLISIQKKNPKLIKLLNINKQITFENVNFYTFGPKGFEDIIKNIIGEKLSKRLNNIPKYNTYFELLFETYIIMKKASKRYNNYVNQNYQISISSEKGLLIISHPNIKYSPNEYPRINFPEMKEISNEFFNNIYNYSIKLFEESILHKKIEFNQNLELILESIIEKNPRLFVENYYKLFKE